MKIEKMLWKVTQELTHMALVMLIDRALLLVTCGKVWQCLSTSAVVGDETGEWNNALNVMSYHKYLYNDHGGMQPDCIILFRLKLHTYHIYSK